MTSDVREALRALGVKNFVLAIHDASFPSAGDEEIGRGSPYSRGAAAFLRFVQQLGFTGIQLGPQGQVSRTNPSPYDSTLFSRNLQNLALRELVEVAPTEGLLAFDELSALVEGRPAKDDARAQHPYVFDAVEQVIATAFTRFQRRQAQVASGQASGRQRDLTLHLAASFAAFRRVHADWLHRDSLYGVLCDLHRAPYWRDWTYGPEAALDQRLFAPAQGEAEVARARASALAAAHRETVDRYAFGQYLLHEQHQGLRARAQELGLKLYGDLQIGFSAQDTWAFQSLFLGTYHMGAPPSRTNPEGQPWNYPVFDPEQYQGEGGQEGPVLRLMVSRMNKLLGEFDGVRIDHPHGLVCPWVYHADSDDPLAAVQGGARLFCSPNLPDHPQLARYAIAKLEQLAPKGATARYADDWCRQLTDEQVLRYSVLIDTIVAAAKRNGRQLSDLLCEVLSTLPYPLRRVMERYKMGRFRVTQKANVLDPSDVYRTEHAGPADWVMLGNHDTKPIWAVAESWEKSGALAAQAAYLAERLRPSPSERPAFAKSLEVDKDLLVQAKLADLFVCRAENVMVFFADLFGMSAPYNQPGTVSPDNWTLRVPKDYAERYANLAARNKALHLPRALAMAIEARGEEFVRAHAPLLARLKAQHDLTKKNTGANPRG